MIKFLTWLCVYNINGSCILREIVVRSNPCLKEQLKQTNCFRSQVNRFYHIQYVRVIAVDVPFFYRQSVASLLNLKLPDHELCRRRLTIFFLDLHNWLWINSDSSWVHDLVLCAFFEITLVSPSAFLFTKAYLSLVPLCAKLFAGGGFRFKIVVVQGLDFGRWSDWCFRCLEIDLYCEYW